MRITEAALKCGLSIEDIEHAVVHHVDEVRDQGDHPLAVLIGPSSTGALLEVGVPFDEDGVTIRVVAHVMDARPRVPENEETMVTTMASETMTDDELAAHFENVDFDSARSMGRGPLRALQWATQFREYIDQQLVDVVTEARESGATWTQIGAALGVSHQAAIKRYKRSA